MATIKFNAPRRSDQYTPVDILEQTTHLVRAGGGTLLPLYYIGALPFALGAIYFVSDAPILGHDPERLARAALILAVLFCWKTFCQAWYAGRVMALACGIAPPHRSPRAVCHLFLAQSVVQIAGLVLLPLSLFCGLFGIVAAFLNSFPAITAVDPDASFAAQMRKAARTAFHNPRSQYFALLMLFVFGIMVFLNMLQITFIAPMMLKTFLGIDTAFTKASSLQAIFGLLCNSTVLATAFMVTCLAIGPFVKAFHVLHLFHADSVTKGYDLLAEIRQWSGRTAVAAALFFTVLVSVAQPAAVANEPPATGRVVIEPVPLSNAIARTLGQREYLWHMPPPERDVPQGFLQSLMSAIHDAARHAADMLFTLLDKLFGRLPDRGLSRGMIGSFPPVLMWSIAVVVFIIIAALVLRHITTRRRAPAQVHATPSGMPDLHDEAVTADDAATDQWMLHAADLIARGSLRLAMRALFLASISSLGGKHAVTVARHKTNREYLGELRRRYHDHPDAIAAFRDNMLYFERVWYGEHEATMDMINAFQRNNEVVCA